MLLDATEKNNTTLLKSHFSARLILKSSGIVSNIS